MQKEWVEDSYAFYPTFDMRRRLAKVALMMVVLPLGARAAEVIADRLEAGRSPSTTTKLLRRGSSIGRRLARTS